MDETEPSNRTLPLCSRPVPAGQDTAEFLSPGPSEHHSHAGWDLCGARRYGDSGLLVFPPTQCPDV